MVVGESGLGKSTLINSMFLTDIYSNEYPGPSQRLKKTVAIDTQKVLLKEKGVNLTLTVVDTPGNLVVKLINWIILKNFKLLRVRSEKIRKLLRHQIKGNFHNFRNSIWSGN